MTTDVIIKALESDLGKQYTSDEFAKVIKNFNMTHSFSYKGNPYDNACIESFHAILKKEEVNHVRYLNFESAKLALFQYIEGWYNRMRIHSSIVYIIRLRKRWKSYKLVPHEFSSIYTQCTALRGEVDMAGFRLAKRGY